MSALSEMSDIVSPSNIKFSKLDQVAMFTVKMIKRLVRSGIGGNVLKQKLLHLIVGVESNIKSLNLDKDMFFDTVRDYSRIFRHEWQGHEKAYNNMLIVAALRLGIERLWVPDGYHPFLESEISELVSLVFPSDAVHFSLKELDQSEPSFDYFAKHSPKFENIYLPRSDNVGFMKCCQFRNLRVIEFAGGVSDKVLCNALWNTGSKKSEKILDLALTKDHKSWNLALPHLEVLENNIYRYDNFLSTMRITLGAAAFAIQPKMAAAGSRLEWGTYEAILHLLDMEAKYKVLPMSSIKKLTLDASALTDLELSVLIASAKQLEHLTLQMTPQSIFNYNLPKLPYPVNELDWEEYKAMFTFPSIKTLVIEFFTLSPVNMRIQEMDPAMEGHSEAIIGFLSSFPTTTEIYFRNTNLLPPLVLVFGCFGGAIAVLFKLAHVSIIAWHEEVPCPDPVLDIPPDLANLSQFLEVQRLLPDLEEDVTFRHLEKLKSLEIDEIYVSPYFDNIIKALRLSGVNVSVKYRRSPKSL
ncbi:uncharacterized protein [Macrobrachium rosenbergii]|uniref:uncharacterized protein isoform X3 n=1 Tax=Macrobrachium rosenbergii TaxID=79674 RepID=UPI0034D6DE44